MTSQVKIRKFDFMDGQSENETLQARIREVEDENQELRAQNLLQNRTIIELRNELLLLRIQMSELSDTSQLLRERVRNLAQNAQQRQQQNENTSGPVTAPPLMAPPPVPPPLPPTRIRISPRQVGAGEALTTPLGISVSSPPRHRVKRDSRQGFYKSIRNPYRRLDGPEPGPSTQTPSNLTPERPNYFVGLKIFPQFQSFVCAPDAASSCTDSASDSSGSDENPQNFNSLKTRLAEGKSTLKKISKDFEILKNFRNFNNQKVRQSILQNYNLSLPSTNSKFFFPFTRNEKNKENSNPPSTSGNEVRYFHGSALPNDRVQTGSSEPKPGAKVSDCVQYTFPTIHEGFHQTPIDGSSGQPSRMRKFKKNIPYLPLSGKSEKPEGGSSMKVSNPDSESLSSIDESKRSAMPVRELASDLEQDGFQADESSNCMTSTDNSLEKICISESNTEMKK